MKKVLMCSEYSKYSTGYSIYTKELLSRLKDKYEVAELEIGRASCRERVYCEV